LKNIPFWPKFGFLAIVVFISAGCASTFSTSGIDAEVIPNHIPALTKTDGAGIAPQWKQVTIPLKRKTDYRIVKHQGRSAVRASAMSSASGIEAKLSVDLSQKSNIAFSWYADALIVGADNTERHTEDSPLRIVLSFEGDKDTLSAKDQRFHDRAKLITGRELPYATLMYIWENRKPIDSVIINHHTSTIRKMVIASGDKDLKKWKSFKRNITDDYLKAFGKKPGRLVGIALMSDTDNTGTDVTAYYSDITLLEN
jgi:Protein of unknown function (DUF3047)